MARWAKEGARRLKNLAQMNCTRCLRGHSKGMSGIEVIIALGILGLVAIVFLSGLSTALKASYLADERSVAESLARSEMEYVKSQEYETTEYDVIPDVPDDYSIQVTAESLDTPDDGIQKITVTVSHDSEVVFTLEGYKADR